MSDVDIPLFPLRTVLFPGGPLPLRVFEPRYLDMISHCLKQDCGFGVILIRKGEETGPVETHGVGTMAIINDWYQGSDGLLGITALGRERFSLGGIRQQADGLNIGSVDFIQPEQSVPLPERFEPLAHILEGVLEDLGTLYQSLSKHYDDASWVGYRLSEILPAPMDDKQALLELNDPLDRLERLRPLLRSLRTESSQ